MYELTERDWLTSVDAHALLGHLFPMTGFHSTPVQPRKLRLYYVALARRQAAALPAAAEGLLRAAEAIADDEGFDEDEFGELAEVAERLAGSGGEGGRGRVLECECRLAELGYSWPTDRPSVPTRWGDADWTPAAGWVLLMPFQKQVPAPAQLRRAQHDADLIRDLFGNPFAAPLIDRRWRTERVVGVAGRCYDGRDFRALPVLADALQDDGCPDDHPAVRHCREEPSHAHARGCWVLDQILGR